MSTNPSTPATVTERDPVCGMNVNPATAKHVYEREGKNYHFCSAGCAEKFKADPPKYLSPSAPRPSTSLMLGDTKTLGDTKATEQSAPRHHDPSHPDNSP